MIISKSILSHKNGDLLLLQTDSFSLIVFVYQSHPCCLLVTLCSVS